MQPYFEDSTVRLHHGDCLTVMASLPANSVDAIVTDPPYGLGFMGKAWDDLPPGLPWAQECLRVLKPGGHLLAFGGTRTWHRLAVAVEDAGFEVRDSIAWLYGSGFPKSLDVSKAIDKLDAAAERRARALEFTAFVRESGLTAQQIDTITGTNMGGHYTTAASQPAVATADLFDLLRPHLPEVPERIEELVRQRTVESQNYAARPITQEAKEALRSGEVITFDQRSSADRERRDIPHTAEAARFRGWGTALKPAFEPIVVARKPLVGTVAANVLAHGTGALNVDGCRVATSDNLGGGAYSVGAKKREDGWTTQRTGDENAMRNGMAGEYVQPTGRWPTNVVLDGHAAEELDRQSGTLTSGSRKAGDHGLMGYMGADVAPMPEVVGDSGGASRFFPTFRYQAKAPTRERVKVGDVAHPTVKPLALMQWLVRLVTPPDGVVLEPFAGSGTTVEACLLEGFRCIAIEREADYLPLIEARITRATSSPATDEGAPPTLFDAIA